jgi:hypothetical protein
LYKDWQLSQDQIDAHLKEMLRLEPQDGLATSFVPPTTPEDLLFTTASSQSDQVALAFDRHAELLIRLRSWRSASRPLPTIKPVSHWSACCSCFGGCFCQSVSFGVIIAILVFVIYSCLQLVVLASGCVVQSCSRPGFLGGVII